MNSITTKLNVDNLILMALQEDISSEDVTTNAVMREAKKGKVDLICKQDGVIAGLPVFQRVFELLDETVEVKMYFKDGDEVKNGDLLAEVTGDTLGCKTSTVSVAIKDVPEEQWKEKVWDAHIVPDEPYLYKKTGYICE